MFNRTMTPDLLSVAVTRAGTRERDCNMSENLRCGLLRACAGGVLILLGAAHCLAEPPAVKEAPEGFKNLSHLVTVRCGTTPITDERARKLVRVVTPEGR